MTELLKQAMELLSELPPAAQDSAARALIQQLEEDTEYSVPSRSPTGETTF
jgi:hypothetical protein